MVKTFSGDVWYLLCGTPTRSIGWLLVLYLAIDIATSFYDRAYGKHSSRDRRILVLGDLPSISFSLSQVFEVVLGRPCLTLDGRCCFVRSHLICLLKLNHSIYLDHMFTTIGGCYSRHMYCPLGFVWLFLLRLEWTFRPISVGGTSYMWYFLHILLWKHW